jgi:pyruvate/2-oxoacid:ferredoxin oxidoreductase beta subunit
VSCHGSQLGLAVAQTPTLATRKACEVVIKAAKVAGPDYLDRWCDCPQKRKVVKDGGEKTTNVNSGI